MDYIDYYKILGVNKTATAKDIKSAYRKLARKYHPDLNPDNKEANRNFQKINEANEVLSDPEKRKKFDQYGKDWQHADDFENQKNSYREQSANQGNQQYYGGRSDDDFSSFFENLFGGSSSSGRGNQVKYRGKDLNADLHLSLIDAYKTHKQTLTINDKKIRITIPAGIENGQTIKIAGHGGLGKNGGPNGDLYITFSIENHPDIKRLGYNLYSTYDLDLYIAVLGGDITINLLNSKVKMKIAPETQNGSKIKLKGKGFPMYKSENDFGDFIITWNIKIPTNLSNKQKELFTELSKA